MKAKPDIFIKRSFLIDLELAERLEQERAKFKKEHGVSVSLNQVAVKALRAGLAQQQ
jgi:hypothetical protein